MVLTIATEVAAGTGASGPSSSSSMGGNPRMSAEPTEEMIEERVKFELNPTFLPDNASPETVAEWRQMVPSTVRKTFMINQLSKYTALTLVSHYLRASFFILFCSYTKCVWNATPTMGIESGLRCRLGSGLGLD